MTIEQFTERFAKRLAALRKNKGVSARDMSISLGQAESYINKLENMRNLPSMSSFFFICKYLNVTPSEFFSTNTASMEQIHKLTEAIDGFSDEQIEHLIGLINGFKDL